MWCVMRVILMLVVVHGKLVKIALQGLTTIGSGQNCGCVYGFCFPTMLGVVVVMIELVGSRVVATVGLTLRE